MVKKLQKPYLADFNLMIVQDLWQAHYQILLIVLLKEFRKPKCKYGFDDKKCEIFRFKDKNCECCVEYTSVKDDLKEYKCFCCDKLPKIV